MAVLIILSFNAAWSSFIWPLIVRSRDSRFVLNIGMGSILGPYN
jgi:ABC-type glycerol-3-phosphate transport system permease component